MSRSMVLVVLLVLFVAGLFVMFNSVGWGGRAASAYLLAQGGGMDSAQFMIILEASIHTYRWIGGVLSLTSGLSLVKVLEKFL